MKSIFKFFLQFINITTVINAVNLALYVQDAQKTRAEHGNYTIKCSQLLHMFMINVGIVIESFFFMESKMSFEFLQLED